MTAKKILVIEDNETCMEVANAVLKIGGYAILKAGDAETGIELAKTEHPEVILMDISLPGMDGLEATRLLKADPDTARIPVIALTAHAMPGDREKTVEAGCDYCVTKPFDVQKFLELLADLLKKKPKK